MFFQLNSKNLNEENDFFILELYKHINNMYSYIATKDIDYQNFMRLREAILKPTVWFLKSPNKDFNMKIKDEITLDFNSSQTFFNKNLLEYFLNPLFRSLHTGEITELYNPMADIISEYEFETLELSDISPFDR
jgi:hypothetical protein